MNSSEPENREERTGNKIPDALLAGQRGLGKIVKDIQWLILRDLEVLTKDLRVHSGGKPGQSKTDPGKPDPGKPKPSKLRPIKPNLAKSEPVESDPGKSVSSAPASGIFVKAFAGLFLRDLRVLTREFVPFLLRVGMQPLLFLFVFTFILPRMGGGNPMAVGNVASGPTVDFGTILLPGLMAVAIMFSGIAAVALPLSSEFGITREIDDRVMCPLPLWAVALEKVCFSAMQSIIAALMVIPMAYYVPAVPVVAHM